jgi:hypothetical protein
VRWSSLLLDQTRYTRDLRVTVTNANPRPVRFELRLELPDGAKLEAPSARLVRKEGTWLWDATIPANGTGTLTYRVRLPS